MKRTVKVEGFRICKPDDMLADLKKDMKKLPGYGRWNHPGGQCMQNLANGMETIHRDSYYAGLGAARYAIALTYGYKTGNPVEDNA